MLQSVIHAVFGEIPRTSLEADAAVCFVLDEQLRFVYCNPAWDQFARQNGAPGLLAENVLGAPVMQSVTGELHGYYEALYQGLLADGKPRQHDFECSSAEVQRLMNMQLYRLRTTRAILVSCSLRVEQPHKAHSREPVQALYRNQHGLIVMCSNCRRTRQGGVDSQVWDWVSDFVAQQPSGVSHGICNLCLEYYYPAEN